MYSKKDELKAQKQVESFLDNNLYKNPLRDTNNVTVDGGVFGSFERMTMYENIDVTRTNKNIPNIDIVLSTTKGDEWFMKNDTIINETIYISVLAQVEQHYDANNNFVVNWFGVNNNNIIGVQYFVINKEKLKTWLRMVRNVTDDTLNDYIRKFRKGELKGRVAIGEGLYVGISKNISDQPISLYVSKNICRNIALKCDVVLK